VVVSLLKAPCGRAASSGFRSETAVINTYNNRFGSGAVIVHSASTANGHNYPFGCNGNVYVAAIVVGQR
jgi:hypothetical protein